jgi:hypothetical protein
VGSGGPLFKTSMRQLEAIADTRAMIVDMGRGI